MITTTILRLRKASTWPHDFGSRYAQLLELLWQRTDPESSNNGQARTQAEHSGPATSPNQHSYRTPLRQVKQIFPSEPTTSAAFNPQSDFFSWLDLQAVGDAVSGEQNQSLNPGIPGPSSGVDGIQQFLDGATRRGSFTYNATANANNSTNLNGDGGGGDSNLAWLFDDDLVWPDDEYSNLIF